MDGISSSGALGEPPTQQMHAPAPAPAVGGESLVSSSVGDNCANCGAPMSPDQHYCLECGERRGKPRFSLGATQPRREAAPARPAARRFAGFDFAGTSSSATLVLGIATLLLAMGVGVLIGHGTNNGGSNARAAAPQVITVNGGGGGGGGVTSTPTTSTPSSSSSSKSSGKSSAAPVAAAPLPPTVTTVKNLPPAKVQPGGACKPGTAGCSTSGKFTGNFFGQ